MLNMAPRVPEDAPISQSEQNLLDEIYAQFGDDIRECNISQSTLLRFIRGFTHVPDPKEKTLSLLKDFFAWRKVNKVDELLTTTLPKTDEYKKQWQSGIHGMSRDGHPIYIERLGSIDPNKLEATFKMEEVEQFHVQSMERLTAHKDALEKETGKRLYKHYVIIDLKNVGLAHIGHRFREPMRRIIDIDSNKYPETLQLMFVCNASWIIKTIWAIVKPWIDPITVNNIKFSSDYLKDYIDIDQLPRFLGGTCKCETCLVTPFIPGNKVSMQSH